MKIRNYKALGLIAITILFVVLTFAMTYPLFFTVNKSIAGFASTDEPSVWYFWWLKYAHTNNINHGDCRYISYPFGQDYAVLDQLYPLWSGFKRVMAITTNQCFAYNSEVILSFILSGLCMYGLMRFISGNFRVAVFSGIIYAFSPYHFARAWQHIGLTHIQWIPLYVYALLKMKKDVNLRTTIFLSLALFLVASFDYYYLYFMLLVTVFFWMYCLIADKKNSKKLTLRIILSMALTGSVMAIILWPFIKTRVLAPQAKAVSVWSLRRPFEDLFSQSARPLSYLLPSPEHPFLGGLAKGFVGTDIYGMSLTEHALYLGWVPLVLAFVAFRRWSRNRKKLTTSREPQITDKKGFYIGFFVFLAVMAWFFSQPPWWNIFGFKLYMPSFFLYKILPMFRAYCRFGIVVMLAVAVLAGFGLNFILERFKSQKTKLALTALFCGLVLFEFWNWPPYKVIDLSKVPAVYYWLKEQPQVEVIAEYPLDADSPNELFKFFQTVHEKKIINGTIPGTYANKVAQTIRKLSEYDTVKTLKWMGVKYVLVHKDDYLKTDLVEDREDMERIPQNQGLKFVKSFPPQECSRKGVMCIQATGQIDVYEIVAPALEPNI
ncbi:MAG: hypothetical protein Q7J72_03285 [Candidatus Omnitrophota bacterium]|nr:hypothetical protein [Candidatus Omnitrophota bacterium]